jgi:hypothetical protein
MRIKKQSKILFIDLFIHVSPENSFQLSVAGCQL